LDPVFQRDDGKKPIAFGFLPSLSSAIHGSDLGGRESAIVDADIVERSWEGLATANNSYL
jgi:hypothetical protein